ncbi:MAG: YceI family protein [Pseudomonadota bacterium]
MSSDTRRYTKVAVILHWTMALAFIAMLGSGITMTREGLLDQSLQFQMYQWHKSLGVLLLLAFFARLGWKLFHHAPALPDSIKGLEKLAAKAGHYALYFWMIALPATGWVMVSSSPYGLPTLVFNWFEWPHIPGMAGDEMINTISKNAHEILGFAFIALIAVHIAAVIKHAIIDKHNLLTRMWFGSLVLVLLFVPISAQAKNYIVDHGKSTLSFSGTHAGKEFTGVFEEWSAEISFDPEDLESSSARVVINTATAKTGDKMYDGTLPQGDWFDVKNHPEAVFESTEITTNEDGSFQMSGNLTIKQITNPVSFNFTLTDVGVSPLQVDAAFDIDRLTFDIGKKSDAKAEWVAQNIGLQLKVIATSE